MSGLALIWGTSCLAQEEIPAKPPARTQTFSQGGSAQGGSAQGGTATGLSGIPPELLTAFGELYQKLQKNIEFPGERKESRLLALLPESTVIYAAFPNYGNTAKQALAIFHEEMKENAALRDWMAHEDTAAKIDEALGKFQEMNQFVGDEIVLAGSMDSKEPRMVMLAETKKAGMKEFLQALEERVDGKGKSTVRVMDLQELAATKEKRKYEDFFVLVRPDFVLAASDLATLRGFNEKLESGSKTFAATAFARRVEQGYADGITILGASDIHKILSKLPQKKDEQLTFAQSGFADMKYATWEHTKVEGKPVNKAELSFTGPRHGPAAWLAGPAKLDSLDFVSPEAVMAMSVVLTKPGQIFDDLQELLKNDKANPLAAVPVMEQALKISIKDDLLNNLDGELTAELDSVGPQPAWRAIWKVNNATRLQATLGTLLTAVSVPEASFDENGVTYYAVKIPTENSLKLTYAFVDGYWIVGSNPEEVSSAVKLHGSGRSLAKDAKFLEAVPAGYSTEASGMFYQNPLTMMAAQMKQVVAPDMAEAFLRAAREVKPSVGFAYGEEAKIRMASASGTTDMTTILVVAAIAIPNLLRSKMAANEASAVGTVRTLNTAQVTYATMYPKRGYAANIVTFGPDAKDASSETPEHANLIGTDLAGENCAADGWCTKTGYQFKVTARCRAHLCDDYVVVAKPVSENTGTRSFCSTSTGIVHWLAGGPLTEPLSLAKCNEWASIQ